MKRVRTALVGFGPLGKFHAENLHFKIRHAELVAICTRSEDKKQEILRDFDNVLVYSDYKEMLETEELDAIIIASPTSVHLEQVRLAAYKKLHIFIEKPTGIDHVESEIIEKLVEGSDKIFSVGFMRRFDKSYAEAKKKVDRGDIGTPILFRSYSLDHILAGELQAGRSELNGKWFVDMGVHDYDLARWFLGSELKSVKTLGGAYVFKNFADTNDVDNGFSLMEFENGSVAFLYCGRTAPHGSHVESEIVGTKGILRICPSPRKTNITEYRSEGEVHESILHFLDRWGDAYYYEMMEFIEEVMQGKRRNSATAKDGTKALEIASEVLKAYENRD